MTMVKQIIKNSKRKIYQVSAKKEKKHVTPPVPNIYCFATPKERGFGVVKDN